MLSEPEEILAWLDARGVAYKLHRHAPVVTVAEAEAATGHLPGGHTKNLFLEDRAGGLWLYTAAAQAPVKVNGLARLLGCGRMAFARPDRLLATLGVEPGSVTPLALVNDEAGAVRFLLDPALAELPTINVHPLRNSATLALATADLVRTLGQTGHLPRHILPADTQSA